MLPQCIARPLTLPFSFSPTEDVDGWLSVAKSSSRGKARSPLPHQSCLKGGYSPPSPTVQHLGEHPATTHMHVCSQWVPTQTVMAYVKQISVCGELGDSSTHPPSVHQSSVCACCRFFSFHSFLSLHLSVKNKRASEREESESGSGSINVGARNWVSCVLASVPLSALVSRP